ncbi:MAG: SNF2-related protein, partial [Deltaproteobacteria bacterium]
MANPPPLPSSTPGLRERTAHAIAGFDFTAFRSFMPSLAAAAEGLGLDRRYKDLPRINEAGRLVATITVPLGPANERRATLSVWVEFGGTPPRVYRIQCSCHHSQFPTCVHASAVLADVALSKELREAVVAGTVRAALIEDLEPARAAMRSTTQMDLALNSWQRSAARMSTGVFDAFIEIQQREAFQGSEPAIELRLRRRGEKKLYGPREAAGIGLPNEVRELVRGIHEAPGRHGWRATGSRVAPLIEALVTRGAFVEREGLEVAFPAATACIRIERAAVPQRSAGGQVEFWLLGGEPRPEAQAPMRPRRPFGIGHDDEPWYDELDVLELTQPRVAHRPTARPQAAWKSAAALVAYVSTSDGEHDGPLVAATIFPGHPTWVWIPEHHAFHRLEPGIDVALAAALANEPAIALPEGQTVDVYHRLRALLAGRGIRLPSRERMGLPAVATPMFAARVDGPPLDLRVVLEARYPDRVVDVTPDSSVDDPAASARDVDLETAAAGRLREAGLEFSATAVAFVARDESAVRFWRSGIHVLRSASSPAIALEIPESLRRVRVGGTVRAALRVRLVEDWFDTELEFGEQDVKTDIERLRRALSRGCRWIALDDGTIAEIGQSVASLVEDASSVMPDTGRGRLRAFQLGRLDRWSEFADSSDFDAPVEAYRSHLRALAVSVEPVMPRELNAELRPYQRRGLAWLQFLDALASGGVLADDMGLGKTVMALAFLAWNKDRDGAAPSLVVCPASVAGNWVREAAKFTPGLRVMLFHGSARHERAEQIAAHDLVVTTYGVLRQDIDMLSSVEFRAAILDEAQNVKNAEAVTSQAANRLRAGTRLALTGTPVENRLAELWSLMEFCNPGMLGTQASFGRRFERPITLDPAGPAAATLRSIVRPFLLRRTKREVLPDLPPKQEIATAFGAPGSFTTLESQTPVCDFDVLAFSVSFEWDYT